MPRLRTQSIIAGLHIVVVLALVLQSGLPAVSVYAQPKPEPGNILDVALRQPSEVAQATTAPLTTDAQSGGQAAAAPGLSITRSNTNIQLTWTAVAGSQSYEVHRSTAPFFTPSATTLLQTLAANATTYTDNGAAGDPNINHYYIVQAVNGSEKTASNTVGEIDYALNNAGGKYSLIALPFPSTTLVNAASLASYITHVGALLKWNPTTQTFRFFTPPSSGDNFPVTTGDAIFVLINSSGPSVVTMMGTVTPLQYNLKPVGFNFVSMPSIAAGAVQAPQPFTYTPKARMKTLTKP